MVNDSQDDLEELLCLADAGDSTAVQQIFDRFRPRLKIMISRRMDPRLARRIDPSDVVQECLMDAHVKFREYLAQRPVPFYLWLRAIAWDRLVDLHRRHVTAQRRSVDREVPIDVDLSSESAEWLASQLVSPGSGPLSGLARREMNQRVRSAVSQLSKPLSEALLLRYLEQLSAQEAAQVLGISEAAFKQRLVRALRQIRELLTSESEAQS